MQWDQFLRTAERLALGTTEGNWRSAASRAYYAVYHFFWEWLVQEGMPLPPLLAHNTLDDALRAAVGPGMSPVSKAFHKLLEARRHADYDLHLPFGKSHADQNVVRAASIVADFQAVLVGPHGRQAVGDVRAYFNRLTGLGSPPTP